MDFFIAQYWSMCWCRRRYQKQNYPCWGGIRVRKCKYGMEMFRSFIFSLQSIMWSKNFPFPFPFPFYYFYQYPIPAATSSRGPSLLPKDGETIEHELSLQSIVTQQCHPEQPYPRNRNSVRLSVREKQRRKRNREDNFERKKQKQDRNIRSNIIKNLFQFIRKHPCLASFLQKSTSSHNREAIPGLISKLDEIMTQQGSYVRPIVLQDLWKGQGLEEMEAIVFRGMLRKFMEEVEPIILATRKCFSRKQKLNYLGCCRRLWQEVQANHFIA